MAKTRRTIKPSARVGTISRSEARRLVEALSDEKGWAHKAGKQPRSPQTGEKARGAAAPRHKK